MGSLHVLRRFVNRVAARNEVIHGPVPGAKMSSLLTVACEIE